MSRTGSSMGTMSCAATEMNWNQTNRVSTQNRSHNIEKRSAITWLLVPDSYTLNFKILIFSINWQRVWQPIGVGVGGVVFSQLSFCKFVLPCSGRLHILRTEVERNFLSTLTSDPSDILCLSRHTINESSLIINGRLCFNGRLSLTPSRVTRKKRYQNGNFFLFITQEFIETTE